jgi:PAS domain S-box-containing protein
MTSNTKRAVSNDPRGLIFAALIPLVACGLQLLLWDFFQPFVWFLFYPAVFLSSRVDGLRGGVVATLLATILAWYFFLPTPFSFGVESPVIFVSLGMFVGMGILFSLTHEQLRKINRRVAESLATSDLKLTAALASMTDAVFISDPEGRFIEFNEAFATFHKFRNKEECAKTLAEYPIFLDVFLPNGELAPLAQWAVPRALRGETVENAEYMLRRKDTGESWVGSYSFAPIRDKTGVIVGAVVTGRDITERRRVQEALNLERVRLDTVLKDMQCGVVLFDPDLTNCWMNPEALRIHGFSSLAEMYTRFDRYAQEWELSYPDGRTTPLFHFAFKSDVISLGLRHVKVR